MLNNMPRHKLSATALSTFLESPRQYYWRYIKRLEPIQQSVSTFDHDRIAGILFSEFVDRFYRGIAEQENAKEMLAKWDEQTFGWVPEKVKDRLTEAMKAWSAIYYTEFSPSDGVRNGSEKRVENERFVGYLDGLSPDEKIVHEVKSTSRAKMLSEQLWKVQHSIQVKLYTVLTKAEGVLIEFAYKDVPYSIYRAPVMAVTEGQRDKWEKELNALADSIYALGDNPDHYPCHPDGCCITSKNFSSICQYFALCTEVPGASIAFKPKEHRK